MSDENTNKSQNPVPEKISFGSLLKQGRLKKSFSVEDVSSDLKISIKILKNLESSNLEELPKRAFTKGFIKTYSKYLDIPVSEVLELYESNFESNTQMVQTGVLKKSNDQEAVFISDVFQKTIIPISILFLTIAGVFAVSFFLKSYNPTANFSNTTETAITNDEAESINIKTPDSKLTADTQSETGSEGLTKTSVADVTKVNILVVEPLDKTALLIKTNLDEKFIKARLNPNKPRTFKFESAEISFLDAGAVNLLFNGKDIGVPGNFGEQKNVRYPSKTVQ